MLHGLNALFGKALVERATLLVNHVLGSEPIATDRLRAHVGRCLEVSVDGWPELLPRPPPLVFKVTPAGRVEWCGEAPPAATDLRVAIDASNPALAMVRALGGTRPKIEVAGDAAFATDLNWLFDNLRWDVQDDLARLVGQAPAHEIARFAGGVATALREFVRTLRGAAARR
jgi:ubiquinone biosynthesis protein UbiJ